METLSGVSIHQERFSIRAPTYFPTPLPEQYLRRWRA